MSEDMLRDLIVAAELVKETQPNALPGGYGPAGHAFMGMPVTVSNHMPSKLIGHWILPAHPFYQWLARHFKCSPWVWFPMYEEQALVTEQGIVMSSRMWRTMTYGTLIYPNRGVIRSDVA